MKTTSPPPCNQSNPSATRTRQPAGSQTPASLHSASLFNGHQSVLIEHNGVSYRLQATKFGKLILTK
jgi:hemin uptake protein HemP